ncbi:MAG: trypsin-like peptidase protein [Segetibacter sp.]|jgi:serine protease Do|nr:trypsin-like peptidase protein [Segetibacter sp.]
MDDIQLLDTTERYLKGELSADERAAFEQLRQTTPEVDQMVVEHNMFLHQIEAFGENREFRHQLHEVHNQLEGCGDISVAAVTTGGKVVQLWRKYRKVTGIAASIAGITALVISIIVASITPANNNQIRELSRQMKVLNHNLTVQSKQINILKSKAPQDERPMNGGTSFLIDGKGYLITNAHVVKGSSTIIVTNNKGQEFKARIVYSDKEKDLAFLRIEDEDYSPVATLPYRIKRNDIDLGEQIFTLGFPRDEIVYNEGYLSAKTGYNGDTVTCQIAVSANPGNSGGPVLNRNGEIIGILSTAQQNAEGVVFAIKSKNIYKAIDDLEKEDTAFGRIKTPAVSKLKGMDRVQQIKQIEDCVFMVKGFTK